MQNTSGKNQSAFNRKHVLLASAAALVLVAMNAVFIVHMYATVPFDTPSGLGTASLRSVILLAMGWNGIALFALAWFVINRILNPLVSSSDRVKAALHLDQGSVETAIHELIEREYAIADYSPNVICSLSEDLRFKSLSPSTLKNWGFLPEELVGSRLFDVILPDDEGATTSAFESSKSGQKLATIENRFVRKNTSTVDLHWSIEWSASAREFFTVCEDITARKNLERMKQEFAAMINHDLRSPLTSIVMNLSLVTGGSLGELPEDISRVLKNSARSVDRLIALLNELLDLEKSAAKELTLSMNMMSTDEVIRQAVDEVSGLAKKKSVELILPEQKNFEIEADRERILRVFINLLSNSVKYSPSKSQVKIDCEKIGDQLQFKVIDQGDGVPPQYQSIIFEAYKQVGSDAGRTGGTGLGLAICKAFVEAHGGQIGVQSTSGQGSTFWFTIPMSPPDSVKAIRN